MICSSSSNRTAIMSLFIVRPMLQIYHGMGRMFYVARLSPFSLVMQLLPVQFQSPPQPLHQLPSILQNLARCHQVVIHLLPITFLKLPTQPILLWVSQLLVQLPTKHWTQFHLNLYQVRLTHLHLPLNDPRRVAQVANRPSHRFHLLLKTYQK